MPTTVNTVGMTGAIAGKATLKGIIEGSQQMKGTIEAGGTSHTGHVLPAATVSTVGMTGAIAGKATLKGIIEGSQQMKGTIEAGGITHTDYVLPAATVSTLGGVIVGSDLLVTEAGVLSVDKAESVEGDNTRPITAAAVYAEVGNINALLATI